MSVLRLSAAALAVLVPLACLAPLPAAAETLTCTNLTVLPASITVPGHYCINQNFSQNFTTAAFNIAANNVVLDCNDHAVVQTGTAAVSGVYVTNKSQVTVRNCAIDGFGRGISYFETIAGLSRSNRVADNDVRHSKLSGIQMAGSANIVENNRVTENLGGAATTTYGILVTSFGDSGIGNVVRRNVVTHVAPSVYVNVVGIYLLDVDNSALLDNTVSALFAPEGKTAQGIVGAATVLGTAAVRNNVLAAVGSPPGGGAITYGGTDADGIRFNADPDTINRNVCRDNVVGRFTSNILAETTTIGCRKDVNTEF
jgi:parallel beta-helix repeat protein